MAAGHIERGDVRKRPPVVPLAFDQTEDDGEQRAAGKQHTNRIKILLAAKTDPGKQPDAQDEGDDADRNVDPEDSLPAEVRDEEAAQRRARHGGDAGPRAPDPKTGAPLVGGKDVGQDPERLGRQDGTADALDDARDNQLAGALREAPGDRGEGKDREPDEEEA